MNNRAQFLIETLGLQPHPEGGHFREIHRSALQSGEGRSAITCIYFLLRAGEQSRWHRVQRADELWHHLEGDPLELFTVDPELQVSKVERLGKVEEGQRPQAVVRAGHWQAARPVGEYVLVGCSVGPGFDFADFAMMSDVPEAAAGLRTRFGALAHLL